MKFNFLSIQIADGLHTEQEVDEKKQGGQFTDM
jgi:hypothetical protein